MFMTFRSAQPKSAVGPRMKPISVGEAGSSKPRSSRSTACESCSSKKVRCTQNRPSCARCVARNLPCVYASNRPEASDDQASAPPTQDAPVLDESRVQRRSDTSTTPQGLSTLPSPNTASSPASRSSQPQESQQCSEKRPLEAPAPCSCIESLMDAVEKLDDDFFQLRRLPFDEVLHVTKWLMFSCCRPLDCANCAERPIIHSTLLIICDRIAQIFVCLTRRLYRISTGTMGQDPPLLEEWPSLRAGDLNAPSQLFDGATGQSGMMGACTVDIFREKFGAEHSQEEQLLTIHVLMKSQMRTFTKLLDRVGTMRQCRENEARVGRVKNLITFIAHLNSVVDSILSEHNG